MAENSKIEWTNHTFNPWRGCTHVHPGCDNCYAEAMSKRNPATLGVWGDKGTRVVASESMWRRPLKWDSAAKATGERHRVFCASLADVFEDWQGEIHDSSGRVLLAHPVLTGVNAPWPLTMDHVRRRLFDLIDATPNLDWLLVTKRPENVRRMWTIPANGIDPGDQAYLYRSNVWLLTSISDQATADAMIPLLLECRDLVPILGLSCEPLLGPVDFGRIRGIDWVIVGGESGHGARPYDLAWPRSIIAQCREAGVPVFHKQLGSHVHEVSDGGQLKSWFPNDPKGGDMSEWPEDLRVREFPKVQP